MEKKIEPISRARQAIIFSVQTPPHISRGTIKYLQTEALPMLPKLDITQDIQPLTTFRNNSVKMIRQLK